MRGAPLLIISIQVIVELILDLRAYNFDLCREVIQGIYSNDLILINLFKSKGTKVD